VKPSQLEIIKHFDELSDDMIVPDQIARIMLNVSPRQWFRSRPVPRRQISDRSGGSRVGDIRALVRGQQSAA
jgi:hypothetical protein